MLLVSMVSMWPSTVTSQPLQHKDVHSAVVSFINCVADPHHFNNADPKVQLFTFNADPDSAPHQNDGNLQPLV